MFEMFALLVIGRLLALFIQDEVFIDMLKLVLFILFCQVVVSFVL